MCGDRVNKSDLRYNILCTYYNVGVIKKYIALYSNFRCLNKVFEMLPLSVSSK